MNLNTFSTRKWMNYFCDYKYSSKILYGQKYLYDSVGYDNFNIFVDYNLKYVINMSDYFDIYCINKIQKLLILFL